MHRFSRMHLSPEVAIRNLGATYRGEMSQLAENIALIAVIDLRKDYLAAGYSCMRSCCMRLMNLTLDQALRRIQVARTALRCPELFEYLENGRLGVTTAAVLAPHLEPETAAALLAAAAHRTQREIVQMLEERSRPSALPAIAPAGEPDVETTSCQHAAPHVNSLADLGAPEESAAVAAPLAAPHVENLRRGRVLTGAAGGHEVRLSITDAEYEDLRAAQALLGHAVPSGDPALIYARAMKCYLAHLEKQRLGAKPGAAVPAGTGRGIPKPLVRLVWERDGARCTFLSADGHRCEETGRLELDHITPVALGGTTSPENLRVLCRAHNQYEAERVLGKEHVQRRRELAQRDRAKAKVAEEAGVAQAKARVAAESSRAQARAQARDAMHQARYEDIYSALRGLGFSAAEARRGAEMTDARPDASLEECLRLALTELVRPVALRGERRARCTA